ncbi:MAG TPA: peptide chain release factor N(5)-glutamine methyltransferase [Solirubrobacteraceae bacterium]|nr:peptide chain release factor N(5)-glutamine methyltransferase [Solirubrobacteraceae bacterium]
MSGSSPDADASAGALNASVTVRDALDGAITAIAAAGCETPRLDAEVLLAHVLGVGREHLITRAHELVVAGPAVRSFQNAVRRRAVEREPVAYIVEHKGFRRLDLAVDRRALVPRPETELLVEVGLGLGVGARVLDLGTGSGAIALALKDERPDLHVSGSDISLGALGLAELNADRVRLEIPWIHADLLDGVGEFDVIICNPPYVAESERASLPPEIVRHEPPQALFAGPDGLSVIRELLEQLTDLHHVRLLALEVGAGQARPVAELMHLAGFDTIHVERDLARVQRVLVAERAPK